jgi:1-deoxy-D-xylulose-5-phosphate reductoisomerase
VTQDSGARLDGHDGPEPRRVAILGSTGSIGRQVVDVLTAAGPDAYRVTALAAGKDAATLAEQARQLRPRQVALADAGAAVPSALPSGTTLVQGADALERLAVADDVDLVVVSTGGVVSLRPVLAALRAGKVVATANKETLVAGGHLVMPLARERASAVAAREPASAMASPLAWLRPIDSEQSAIWQCLVGEDPATLARLILTASGGPFRDWDPGRLARARPQDALAHPTWDMGAKITIDSATLMNKGLEVIEAHWLYDVGYEHIDVLVHPQSLVHSLVEFVDGSLKAQLGLPDMRIPIQYALTYPGRTSGPAPRLDLSEHASMTFHAPDERRFPSLAIARAAGRAGPATSAALIAADEVAVERFLGGDLGFMDIPRLVEGAVARFGGSGTSGALPDLDALEALDADVRGWARDARPRAAGAA